jgi:hypothetical protein
VTSKVFVGGDDVDLADGNDASSLAVREGWGFFVVPRKETLVSQPTKTIPKGEPAAAPRRSMRHFKPHPTKPAIGRPAPGVATRAAEGGGRR